MSTPILPWPRLRMDDLHSFAIAFALSQVMLSLLLLWRRDTPRIQERMYVLLLICVTGYLMMPYAAGTPWTWVTDLVQTGVPGMFWLFSASLFDDDFRLRRWHVVLLFLTLIPPAINRILQAFWGVSFDWLLVLPWQLLEFVLLGMALAAVIRHWHADLVEARRTLRLWFCAFNGFYIFVLILMRELLFPEAPELGSMEYLPVGGLLLVTNVFLLEYRQGLFPGSEPAKNRTEEPAQTESAATTDFDPELLARVEQHVARGAYREMGLTIGVLAGQLEQPEYRLRKVINSGLGYRNFNEFLNRYRIREAADRLASKAGADVPVLTIALDVGFRSLSAFNKAFKDQLEMTPTAWRREKLSGMEIPEA